MSKIFHAEFVEKGILKIIFDQKDARVNIFNTASLQELDLLIDELKLEPGIKAAYLVSGKEKNFCAGADVQAIREIESPEDAFIKSRFGQTLFEKWSQLPFPTLAVIRGLCLGGGVEWILSFTYRVCSNDVETRIGLPEVKLGILPGWGGTARLPGLIGVKNALKMILTGQPVSGKRAYQMGLVDDLIPHQLLDSSALLLLRTILAEGDKPLQTHRKKNPCKKGFLENTGIGRNFLLKKTAKRLDREAGQYYPAPKEALKSVIFARENDLQDALLFEARKFALLAVSNTAKNLLHLFSITEAAKKSSPVKTKQSNPTQVDKIGIIGAGRMGAGIAHLAVSHNHRVRIKDIDHQALTETMANSRKIFDSQVKKGRLTYLAAERKMDLFSATTGEGGWVQTGLVIESVTEDLVLKEELLQQMDKLTPEQTIIASNTSCFSISQLASKCDFPKRVAGFHFLYPLHKKPLVEIIRGSETSDETIAILFELAKKWNKIPLVINDFPGFLVYRLLAPYLTEACAMVESGIAIEDIDDAMMEFKMPLGPFRFCDQMGLARVSKILQVINDFLKGRLPGWGILEKLIQVQRLGQSTGKGFYKYKGNEKAKVSSDKVVYKILKIKPTIVPDIPEIQERLLFLMVNEAAHCLQDGVISNPADIDCATVYGIGFPAFRGGLLRYADDVGVDKIYNRLNYFTKIYGEHYQPAPLLEIIAGSDKGFYKHFDKGN